MREFITSGMLRHFGAGIFRSFPIVQEKLKEYLNKPVELGRN
jgi:hypothetical protein